MKKILFILLLMYSFVTNGHDATIVVRNQQGFDCMEEAIREAAMAGKKDILVKIKRGSYLFHDDHLTLDGLPNDVSVSLIGKKVKVYAAGNVIGLSDDTKHDSVYYRGWKRAIVDNWTEVHQCTHLIEIVDSTTKLCRLKLEDEGEHVQAGDFVQISQWFYTRKYEVKKNMNGYVYFIEKNLERCAGGKEWTINYDYVYGKEMPRYRIWHTTNERGTLMEGTATRFLNLTNVALSELRIEGMEFCGNAAQDNSMLIRLRNVKLGSGEIRGCVFRNCHSACIRIDNSTKMSIRKCKFFDNLTTCISSDGNCVNTQITDCLFDNNSCGWNNTFCVNIKGKEFLVSRNIFRNFGYGAIGIGEHYNAKKVYVSGIVENNETYYSPQYHADFKKHTLMDSGAIYLWTQNDDVIIRNNYIHDYIGMLDNRGVFCDDGAANFTIVGNTILRIANSYCIDSRRIKDQHPEKFTNNVNITITDNTVDGRIRFEGRDESNNRCVYGRNIIKTSGGKAPKMKIQHVDYLGNDTITQQ